MMNYGFSVLDGEKIVKGEKEKQKVKKFYVLGVT